MHPDKNPSNPAAGMVPGESPGQRAIGSQDETPAAGAGPASSGQGRRTLHALPGMGENPGGRRKADPPPKPRTPPPPRSEPEQGPTDTELIKALAELLTMPAIPAAMILECDYCRDHFITEGPKSARELVALSHQNPALRGALESLYGAWSKITIVGVLAGYLAKPLLHHAAPEPVLEQVGPILKVPPRPKKEPSAPHSHPQDGRSPAPDGRSATPDQPPRATAA